MGRKGVLVIVEHHLSRMGNEKKIQEPQSAYQMQATFSTTLLQEASSSVPTLEQKKIKHAEKECVLVSPFGVM